VRAGDIRGAVRGAGDVVSERAVLLGDRLDELRKQRALVQQHLTWLDHEIAAVTVTRLTLPPFAMRGTTPKLCTLSAICSVMFASDVSFEFSMSSLRVTVRPSLMSIEVSAPPVMTRSWTWRRSPSFARLDAVPLIVRLPASGAVYAVFNDASEAGALYRLDKEKLQWSRVDQSVSGSLLGAEGSTLSIRSVNPPGLVWFQP